MRTPPSRFVAAVPSKPYNPHSMVPAENGPARRNPFDESEAGLIRRARGGDREAFGELIELHAVRAYRIAYAILQNPEEAEDAVQDAFVTAFKSLRKLENVEAFGSWLGRIVTTRAYDILRGRQRGQKAIEAQTTAVRMDLTHHSPANPSGTKADLALDLEEAIAKLPELHRLAILLRYSEDASTEQIARVLKRPEGTVRRILSESYRLLRLYLKESDAVS